MMIGKKYNIDVSTAFLIGFVAINFAVKISIVAIQNFANDWVTVKPLALAVLFLQVLATLSYILPALAIKDKTYRIAGIILSAIMIVILLVSPIMATSKL